MLLLHYNFIESHKLKRRAGNTFIILTSEIFLILRFFNFTEIFEFDAMDDPPARLDVVVHDSDIPNNETPIGQTEVNFVKNNLSDLGDMWVPLDGRFPQGHQPKLHLRIFLNNSRGTEVVMNYLEKMGKEVGKKVWVVQNLILGKVF